MQQQTNSVKEIIRTASRQVAREQRKVEKRIEKMRDVASKIKSLASKWEEMLNDAATPVEVKVAIAEQPVAEVEPKKKRGRPFKRAIVNTTDDAFIDKAVEETSTEIQATPKRKPGRPKKANGAKTILRKKKSVN